MKTDTYLPNYKIGDKYTCIKDIPDYFIKNKTYTIVNINDEYFTLDAENNLTMNFYVHTPYANTYISYNHFKKSNQIRKQKLEKLKRIR